MPSPEPNSASTPLEPANTQGSVRERALKASIWVALSMPVAHGLQLVRSLVLTRLLFPDAFGVAAIIWSVQQGLAMCSDVGLIPNVVSHKRGDDPRFLQTVWTLGIVRGALLWLVSCAIAYPLALAYDEPALLALVPVAGLATLIAGFDSTAWAAHARGLKQKRVTLVGYLYEVIGLVVVVALAAWLRSVWALVIGNVLVTLVRVVLAFQLMPGIRHKLRWEHSAVRDLVNFGKWVFLSSLMTFLAMRSDRLILGVLIPRATLGVYSIALVLAEIPIQLVSRLGGTVLMPTISEQRRVDPSKLSNQVLRARGALLRLGLLLCLGVAIAAPAFFRYLYDARYHEAGWMAQFLALSAWVTIADLQHRPVPHRPR